MRELNGPSNKRDRRKALGTFYTPVAIARVLARWAIRRGTERVFDPSFGCCAFLDAAVDRLRSLGANAPEELVFGVDIDPKAFCFTEPIVQRGARKEQFLMADFLEVNPTGFSCGLFDVVIANPPYVRHHILKGESRIKAEIAWKNSGIPIGGRASYWAHFLVHSLRFLAPRGRIAFILPGAFLHADYASVIRGELLKRFRRTLVVLLQERVFADAQEESVIVLGEDYGALTEDAGILEAHNSHELDEILFNGSPRKLPPSEDAREAGWLQALMSKRGAELYQTLSRDSRTTKLGQLCRIRIGTVTGANKFFLLSEKQQRELKIPDSWLRPVINRSSLLKGITFTDEDWISLAYRQSEKVFLLDTNSGSSVPPSITTYLEQGRIKGFSERYKCRARSPWHAVPVCPSPDAFFQYMVGKQPRLILNETDTTCTNAIHGLTWKKPLENKIQASLALSVFSSLGRLSAELVGRSYGGGVLKLEPREAARVVVSLPQAGFPNAREKLKQVDTLIRSGNFLEALRLADDIVLRDHLGLSSKDVSTFQEDVSYLERRRSGHKKSF